MSEWSDGPWVATPLDPEETYFLDVNVLRPDGLAVAAAFNNGDINAATTLANAVLIAASPTMLGALLAVRARFQSHRLGPDEDAVLKQVDQAIKVATRQEPSDA